MVATITILLEEKYLNKVTKLLRGVPYEKLMVDLDRKEEEVKYKDNFKENGDRDLEYYERVILKYFEKSDTVDEFFNTAIEVKRYIEAAEYKESKILRPFLRCNVGQKLNKLFGQSKSVRFGNTVKKCYLIKLKKQENECKE